MSRYHLKFLLDRLNDEEHLLRSLPTLTSSILNVAGSGTDDTSIAKLHTRLSALVQAKDAGIRWCGVCLMKGMLTRDIGRWETLMSHGSTWMKLLLRILEREVSEPVVERTISLIQTIIGMTEGKPTLTRELTTPALPTYLTHLFAILARQSLSSSLLKTILYHVGKVLMMHATTFRPFAGKLKTLVMRYMNGSCTDAELVDLAARCYACLHLCAPKNTAAEQWSLGFTAVLGECHASVSHMFQHVVEDKPLLPVPAGMDMAVFTSDYESQISLAVHRFDSLTQTIEAFLSLPTKDIVKVPVGQLVMLLQRVLEVTPKSGIKASTPQTAQVALISVLPQLHRIALNLLSAFLQSLGKHMTQHIEMIQDLVVADCTSSDIHCRCAAISALVKTIQICGLAAAAAAATEEKRISRLVRDCTDIVASIVPPTNATVMSGTIHRADGLRPQKKRKHAGGVDGSDLISHDAAFHIAPREEVYANAISFLATMLAHTTIGGSGGMSGGLRVAIDVTILKLLNIHGAALGPDRVVPLLQLLKSSLLASDASPHAASLLSAGLATVASLTTCQDPLISAAASSVRDDLDPLIHPRLPALRRRPQYDDGIVGDEDESDGDGKGAEAEDEEHDESLIMMDDDVQQQQSAAAAAAMVVDEPKQTTAFALPESFPSPQRSAEPSLPVPEAVVRVTESYDVPAKKAKLDLMQPKDPNVPIDDDDDDDEIPEICTDSDTDDENILE